MMQFTPLKDFYAKETRSQYVTGLSYFAKDDEAHATLRALIPQWLKDGLIRLGPPTAKEIQRHLPGDREHQSISSSDVGTVPAELTGAGEVK